MNIQMEDLSDAVKRLCKPVKAEFFLHLISDANAAYEENGWRELQELRELRKWKKEREATPPDGYEIGWYDGWKQGIALLAMTDADRAEAVAEIEKRHAGQ